MQALFDMMRKLFFEYFNINRQFIGGLCIKDLIVSVAVARGNIMLLDHTA